MARQYFNVLNLYWRQVRGLEKLLGKIYRRLTANDSKSSLGYLNKLVD